MSRSVIGGWKRSFLHGLRPQRGRLEACLSALEGQLAAARPTPSTPRCPQKLEEAQEFLERAQTAVSEGRLDEGWRCFHAAARAEVFCLGADELEHRRLALCHEVEHKLEGSWRKEAVRSVLGCVPVSEVAPAPGAAEEPEPGEGEEGVQDAAAEGSRPGDSPGLGAVEESGGSPSEESSEGGGEDGGDEASHRGRRTIRPAAVAYGMALRDEATDNLYFRMSYLRNQLVWLLFTLLLAVVAAGAISQPQWYTTDVVRNGTAAEPSDPEKQIHEATKGTGDNLRNGEQSQSDSVEEAGRGGDGNAAERDGGTGSDTETLEEEGSEATEPAAASSEDGEEDDSTETAAEVPTDQRYLIGLLLFGIIGGAFSALLDLSGRSSKKRIPQQIADSWVTVLRPGLGAASALVVYIFFQADILQLVPLSPPAMLALAFVAGWNERFVVRGVQKIEKT